MEREPQFEKSDFKRAEITIEEPRADKNFMISFEGTDSNQVKAYNRAIREICDEQRMNPFHQHGSHDDVGYQAWEMWKSVDRGTLEELIPAIHKRAEANYREWKDLGFIE